MPERDKDARAADLSRFAEQAKDQRFAVDARFERLALAGIAVVWLFHVPGAAVSLPIALYLPTACFVLSLGLDFLDYLVRFFVYRDSAWLADTAEAGKVKWFLRPFVHLHTRAGQTIVRVPMSFALFAVKILILSLGYFLLLRFVLDSAEWGLG